MEQRVKIVKEYLENKKIEIQKLLNTFPKTVPEIENFMTDICELVNNCSCCPENTFCKFAREGCIQAFQCETCPRLRICLREGNRNLYIYLRDCKLNGRGVD